MTCPHETTRSLKIETKSSKIAILLGTFNGGKFIRQQIESIQNQTVNDWRLFIRDDGSIDDTLDLIYKLNKKDERISHIDDDRTNLGVVGNYRRLMDTALEWGADRIYFCDQDDIWHPNKIRIQLEQIDRYEKLHGPSHPILVHTNLSVVDQNLKLLHNSFFDFQGIRHENHEPLKVLLAQNFVTGCASAFNRALLELAAPIPENVAMHDWWTTLCAATFGKIGFVSAPLTSYRQHKENTVGAKPLLYLLNPFQNNLIHAWRSGYCHFRQSIEQAASLLSLISEYPAAVSPKSARLINAYATCLELNRLKRLCLIYSQDIHRQRFIFQFLFYIRLLLSNTTTQYTNEQ